MASQPQPITGWKETYTLVPWMIKCEPTQDNYLTKDSAIDTFQIRNLSTKRFIKKIGVIESKLLFTVHSIVAKTLSVRYRLVVD
ncbi:MAG: type II toxin-antitoxin system PemK/MazF family toxin [Sulfurovum sp.]|nr:type II toxin-antitoxin system PemK/MazF family toxin [Sulfurovum sp.]